MRLKSIQTSKLLYNKFKNHKTNSFLCSKQDEKQMSPTCGYLEKNLFFPFTVTVETKIREFQYKTQTVSYTCTPMISCSVLK